MDESLIDYVYRVETMSKARTVERLAETQRGPIEEGLLLAHIRERSDWWGGKTFRETVEALGYGYRKAMNLIQIAHTVLEQRIPPEVLAPVGWTKLSVLTPVVTRANARQWIDVATDCTAVELRQLVKECKQSASAPPVPPERPEAAHSVLAFTVTPDQRQAITEAIDRAMIEADTDSRIVALDCICSAYLASQ